MALQERLADKVSVLGVGAGPATAPRGDDGDRGGFVAPLAVVGLLVAVLAASVWLQWILSPTEFSPAPILGPDDLPTWRLVLLRIEEGLSVVEMVALLTFAVVIPLRRFGRLGLDAKIAVGCLVGSLTDGVLNMHQYLFAWNAHSVNMGSWASFVPTNSPDHQSRYAEALLWGIPMYTYFCIGVAIVGCRYIARLRERRPGVSNAAALARIFGFALIFDFVVENIFLRTSQAYAFVRTPSEITLFAGTQYQFPLYEPLTVALLGVFFTGLRLSAMDSADGLSWAERGAHRLPARWQGPARWFAVIAVSFTALFVIYHLPFQFFGLNGDSVADLPSYMLPGD